jgi:hypothetical protein
MKGWSEDEFKNKELMAPCGLYCGTCSIYIATRDNNEKLKSSLGKLYGIKPKEIECFGCMQTEPPRTLFSYCQTCDIRTCIRSKGYYSCHQCGQWPCSMIDNFFITTGARVMKRTIPVWRQKVAELGDEKGSIEWARSECERYHCSFCGNSLFRGAQTCRVCKKNVADELDGGFAMK